MLAMNAVLKVIFQINGVFKHKQQNLFGAAENGDDRLTELYLALLGTIYNSV